MSKRKEPPRIAIRTTEKEKETIFKLAEKCGLSASEYARQRALGYEPRAVPPDALFKLLEKIGYLENKSSSPELDSKIEALLHEITNTLLLPGKDGGTLSQLTGQNVPLADERYYTDFWYFLILRKY